MKLRKISIFYTKKYFCTTINVKEQMKSIASKYSIKKLPDLNKFIDFQNSTIGNDQNLNFIGRVILVKEFSNIIFAEVIVDTYKKIQISIDKNTNNIKIKTGQVILFSGVKILTKAKTETLLLNNLEILSSSDNHFPKANSFQGLKNLEVRYEKRYLDYIINYQNKEKLIKRNEVIQFLRNYLTERDFLEVETPTLINTDSGANAKPFITHHNSLKKDLFLRVAPEILLKKLIISGFDKIFEIGKNFRNEDLSPRHNPEFTSCEFYSVGWNYLKLMDFTIGFIAEAFEKFKDNEKILSFKFIDCIELLENKFNCKLINLSESDFLKLIPDEPNISKEDTLNNILEIEIEKILDEHPTFVFNHPTLISPLSKRIESYTNFTERFEFYIDKIELINSYSELTDYKDQKERLSIKDKDKDFIEALSYGMPPTGGWGLGIDRLVMILLNESNIKEVICFPLMNKRL